MNKLHNTIAMENKQAVVLDNGSGAISHTLILALMTDIAQLGYTLSAPVISALETQTDEDFVAFHSHLVETLKNMVGANVKYRPLFKKFPEDIPDDEEYFTKRIIGFVQNLFDITPRNSVVLSCGHAIDDSVFNIDAFGACPICQHQVAELDGVDTDRIPLKDLTPFKVIGLITTEDVYQIFTNLLAAKASISDTNKEVISELVEHDSEVLARIPETIPMKENLALIAGLVIQHTTVATEHIKQHFKTATDVLRLAVQLSGGDVSLAVKSHFKLTNKERKVIMSLLDNIDEPEVDMVRHRMRWVRLGHHLHIGSHKKRFPNAFKAIDIMRNDAKSVVTFGSSVEHILHDIKNDGKDYQTLLVELLATRPGEFARRLDLMLREAIDNKEKVIRFFGTSVPKLTTPMLLSLSAHFQNRHTISDFRYFIPKGKVSKIQSIDDTRKTIDSKIIDQVLTLIRVELHERFAKLDSLGKVYLDPELRNYVLPMTQRSATKSLVTIPRGSRVEIPETKAVRMFLWWKNGSDGPVDVDLSAVAYDEDMNYKFHLSYTNMSDVGGVHSGDIQNAPDGASEFIDIDIEKSLNAGVRYVCMNVISYTGQPFNTFECFAGVMGRDKPNSGQPYEPTTVAHKFDVAGDTRLNLPLMFDLKTRQIVWMDLALTSGRYANVENKSDSALLAIKAVNTMLDTKPTMFDLFALHAQVRATKLDSVRDPDVEYDLVLDASKATELDDILANWM